MDVNVFSTFGACAAGENALTEAFVFVLQLLLERESGLGLEVVGRLCDLEQHVTTCDPASVAIATQVTVEQGRPDIELGIGSDVLWPSFAWLAVLALAYYLIAQIAYRQIERLARKTGGLSLY